MAGALILSCNNTRENVEKYTHQHLETLENPLCLQVWASLCTGRVLQSQAVWSFCGKVSVAEGYKRWLLWKAAWSFPYVQQSQCQTAPRWTCHWSNLEPISEGGSTSGIAQLRRKKKTLCKDIWSWREERECRHQGQCRRRRRRRCSRHWRRDSLAACGQDHVEAGCAPAAHGGPWWSRSPPEAHGETHTGAGGCLKDVTLWGARAGGGSWQELWTCGERSPHRSRFTGRTCDRAGNPCWNSLFLKDCTPWKGSTLEQFMKNCTLWEWPMMRKFVESCVRDPTLEQGKSVQRKEQQGQCVMGRR